MISPASSPETALLATALHRMLLDPVWGPAFEKACEGGSDALRAKAARFASALAAREPEIDAPVEAVTVALTAAARELHPDSPAATESLAAASAVPAAAPAEVGTVPDERWTTNWACEYMRLALQRLAREYPADADVPTLDAETDEIYAASDAEDRVRYRRAVDAWLESALRTIREPKPPPAASAYDEDWAASEIARAIIYVETRTAPGDAPEPYDEWCEVNAAQQALDEPRLRAALRSAVQASLRELRREGRLLPEPTGSRKNAKHEVALGSPAPKTAPQQAPAGSAWGARPAYRERREGA